MWPLPLFIGCLFAPESPWWYVRKGRIEEAKKSLLRLTTAGADPSFSADETIAMMIHTNAIEMEIQEGTSYLDCFKGVDARRTEIVSATWVIQAFCGSAFMGFSTYFYENAGLATTNAFDLNMTQYALGAIGTMASWFFMRWAGRRSLYVWGLVVMFILLLVIGFVGIEPESNKGASWAIGSMLLIYTFVYDLTVGPVCYSLVAEISSTRLKAKSIVLAQLLQYCRYCQQYYRAPYAQPNCLELGREIWLLLGRLMFYLLDLDLFQTTRAEREDIW